MVPIVLTQRSRESDTRAPRINIVAVLVLLGFFVAGLLGTLATANPVPLVVLVGFGLIAIASRCNGSAV
jgi:hypothetical protein